MVLLGAIVLAACVGGVIYYLIADQEHGVHGDTLVAQVCALGRQVGFPVLIRPIDTETSTIRRAIDRGPCGLLLPTVESATQLDRVRDSIWMPPRGKCVPGGRATTGWGISATRRGRPAWRMTSSFCRRSNRERDWSASTNETQNKTGEASAPVAHSRSRVTVVVEMPKTTPQGEDTSDASQHPRCGRAEGRPCAQIHGCAQDVGSVADAGLEAAQANHRTREIAAPHRCQRTINPLDVVDVYSLMWSQFPIPWTV